MNFVRFTTVGKKLKGGGREEKKYQRKYRRLDTLFPPLPSLSPPFSTAYTESCLFSIPLDYVWPRPPRRLINVKLIGKHGWVPVLRANFRSSGSRRKEKARIFV